MLNFPPEPIVPALPFNPELSSVALNFKHAVDHLDQYGFGHLLSGLSNTVTNSDPNVRAMIQQNVNTFKRGFMLMGYCSVWDHFFDRKINSTDQKKISQTLLFDPDNPQGTHWVSEDDSLRFRALKHIRHSVAHSFNGLRATNNRKHFELVMESSTPFQGVSFDADMIDISKSQVDHDSRQLFKKISEYLAGRLMNNNPFP